MNDKSYLDNPILHAKLTQGMTVTELVEQYQHCAFGAGRLAKAVNIYRKMQVSSVTNFFGLAGAMIPAGMRKVIVDM